MKILHITPHLGGGVGTVLMDWIGWDRGHLHRIACLDYANAKAWRWSIDNNIMLEWNAAQGCDLLIRNSDIVLVHYWDHPLLKELLSRPLPPCRMVFWCHKNVKYSDAELAYPDLWIDTSPIQKHGAFIWSTGDISRFLDVKPVAHEGFNIGYVGTISYTKIHPEWYPMCEEIKKGIPDAKFFFVGENKTAIQETEWMRFIGKVDDVAPYLAEMDVFGYPLRPDHYGTCEQVLGEAMAVGVVPIIMNNPCETLIVDNLADGLIAATPSEYIGWIEQFYKWRHRPPMSLLSSAAKRKAKALYSIDNMIQSWDRVFKGMMDLPKTEKSMGASPERG